MAAPPQTALRLHNWADDSNSSRVGPRHIGSSLSCDEDAAVPILGVAEDARRMPRRMRSYALAQNASSEAVGAVECAASDSPTARVVLTVDATGIVITGHPLDPV